MKADFKSIKGTSSSCAKKVIIENKTKMDVSEYIKNSHCSKSHFCSRMYKHSAKIFLVRLIKVSKNILEGNLITNFEFNSKFKISLLLSFLIKNPLNLI